MRRAAGGWLRDSDRARQRRRAVGTEHRDSRVRQHALSRWQAALDYGSILAPYLALQFHFGATMPVNLSVKNVPEAIAAKLRERAARNHRSLQGELMAILENAAIEPNVTRTSAGGASYETEASSAPVEGLLDRLRPIAGN